MTPENRQKLLSVAVAMAVLSVLFVIFGPMNVLATFGIITIVEVLFKIVATPVLGGPVP